MVFSETLCLYCVLLANANPQSILKMGVALKNKMFLHSSGLLMWLMFFLSLTFGSNGPLKLEVIFSRLHARAHLSAMISGVFWETVQCNESLFLLFL